MGQILYNIIKYTALEGVIIFVWLSSVSILWPGFQPLLISDQKICNNLLEMKHNVPERAVFAVEVSKFVLKGHITDA